MLDSLHPTIKQQHMIMNDIVCEMVTYEFRELDYQQFNLVSSDKLIVELKRCRFIGYPLEEREKSKCKCLCLLL